LDTEIKSSVDENKKIVEPWGSVFSYKRLQEINEIGQGYIAQTKLWVSYAIRHK